MKMKLMYCALAVALAGLVPAQPVGAQDEGIGGLLDWINKLSGPRMVGPALTGWIALNDDFVVRGSVAARWSSTTDESIRPTDNRVSMVSLQPTVEYRISEAARLGAGFAFHHFGGDADGFWHPSFPLYTQVRFPMESRWKAVVTVGAQVFTEFDAADFDPLIVDVSRDGAEASLWLSAGVEYVWPGG
jgi:hypothetical protein